MILSEKRAKWILTASWAEQTKQTTQTRETKSTRETKETAKVEGFNNVPGGFLQCFAWALIPNHIHLLLRTGSTPLRRVMKRLLTGHAVYFNKRNQRSGHLFQNRYKSLVYEEDPYLLERVRYIHLNLLRARMVKDLTELDRYPWSGHSAIMGLNKNEWQEVEEVLLYFSEKITRTALSILDGNGKKGSIPPLWDGKAGERIIEILVRQ